MQTSAPPSSAPRSLGAARAAFLTGDASLSRAVHDAPSPAPSAEAGHVSGDTTAATSLFFAALDGASASLLLLSAVQSGTLGALPPSSAFALLVSLSAARGARDWQRVANEGRVYAHERAREEWELRNFRAGEEEEMTDLWVAQGASRSAAAEAIRLISPFTDLFVNIMMREELQLKAPDCAPWQAALASSGGLFLGGVIPHASYAAFSSLTQSLLPRLHALLPSTAAAAATTTPTLQARALSLLYACFAHPLCGVVIALLATLFALEASRHLLLPLQASLKRRVACPSGGKVGGSSSGGRVSVLIDLSAMLVCLGVGPLLVCVAQVVGVASPQ